MIALLKGEAETWKPSVIGIDPGLTKVSIASSGPVETDTPQTISLYGKGGHPKGQDLLSGPYKLSWWWEHFDAIVRCYDVVVIEDYSKRARFKAHDMGEMGGLLRLAIAQAGCHYAIVPPARLRMFATGSGIASKSDMIDAARDLLGYQKRNPLQADALWLLQIGLHLAAPPEHPRRVDLPEKHLRALNIVSLQTL